MAELVERARSGGGNSRGRRASFGSIRQRAPKRFQARYTGPDGHQYTAYSPGGSASFPTRGDADRALARVRVQIDEGTWVSPTAIPEPVGLPSFGAYAEAWLDQRPLATRTRDCAAPLYPVHLD